DRKSTRLNSSHVSTSYAVFCLKKKKQPDGDGHFLNACAQVIDHAAAVAHCGHAGGKAMLVDNVRGGFRCAVKQGFAPVAYVLPRAQQGKRAWLIVIAASLFLHGCARHRDLHSFPTRRSSD